MRTTERWLTAAAVVILALARAGCASALPPAEPTPTRTPPWEGPTSTPAPTHTPTPEGRASSPRGVEDVIEGQPADALGQEAMTVRGRVVDADGRPVEGIAVELGYWDLFVQGISPIEYEEDSKLIELRVIGETDKDGMFTMTGVPPSKVVLGDRFVVMARGPGACPPNCASGLRLDGQAILTQCAMTEELPPPFEEWLLLDLEEGEAIDLGDVLFVAEGDARCQ